jgi:hypothetical protein
VRDHEDDSLVETLWHDLDGQVPRDQIDLTVTEIVQHFQNAKVTTFVPIFIHRRALEQLRGLLVSTNHTAGDSAQANGE